MKANAWEVWFAEVEFEEYTGTKKRPVLFISKNAGIATCLKMTSHPPRDNYDYPLIHWLTAGLHKPTTVRTSKMLHIDERDLVMRIGQLQHHDIKKIQALLVKS